MTRTPVALSIDWLTSVQGTSELGADKPYVVFWVGHENWRSQGAMTKIGGVKREGLFERKLAGNHQHYIFEITKRRYQDGGRALVM